jgi:hypothetical protein
MKARTKPPLADGTCGLIPPAEMFDRVLPGRLIIGADLPFEERVERALRHIEVTRFTEDEYERLREVLGEVIEGDRRGVMPAKEVKRV